MGKTTEQRYTRICSLIADSDPLIDRSEILDKISSELDAGSILLDNYLYRSLGLSGDELLEVLRRGWF